ncbi:helix-turn-helix domain-containing protein [Paenibacillus apiarius]|uniref:Helix-turn-helix domain-containing protein n=1 Tax=Paenibacillus apiarius TaxID=46240 RepID=A0ABT4DVK7_9BACL|nr:helix-turn-helix transcriptional regulator [Paenibacillus apiarius]MCY9513267.1 helix-turn-helix domain-containing protein [Paenibacillus apiarius]MCY9521374.1 helix-turn-helix domain-containing protein [Paenibacillus apiarius]MCY9554480.1 helix-turn-helix domain-containing protein [Paenibacillus apiarius]MCY9560683.1 helix-turn-helix domain-containing protein [Paenibacillus apiarius]MCY9685066.1 helix-turn-helix domain-containing protein [Paenibacillus apiarius]
MRTIEEIIQDMKAHGTSPETIDKNIADLEAALEHWYNSVLRGKITFRDARTNLSLSYEEVSQKLGISEHRIKKYEEDNRNMPYELLAALCKLYRISIDHLFIGKTPGSKNKNHLNMSLAGR